MAPEPDPEPEAPAPAASSRKEESAAAAARRMAERPKANLKLQRQANAHKIADAMLERDPVVITNPRSPGFNLFGTAHGYLFAAELTDDELKAVAKRLRGDENPADLLPPGAIVMPMAAIRLADLDPAQATLDVRYVLEDGSEDYLALPGSSMKEMNELVGELGKALHQTHRLASTASAPHDAGSRGWAALIGGLVALAATGGAVVWGQPPGRNRSRSRRTASRRGRVDHPGIPSAWRASPSPVGW